MTITGEYNRQGYEVLAGGFTIYRAGNHKCDSQLWICPKDKGALPLRTLRKFCIQTAREIARERGEKFAGVSRTEECEP